MVKIKMLKNYRDTYLKSEIVFEDEERAKILVRTGHAQLLDQPIKKGYKTK